MPKRPPFLVYFAEEDDEPLTIAQAWAEAVLDQVKIARAARKKHDWSLWAAEKMEDWSPDDQQIHRSFRRLWTADSTLVWMAFQLERWTTRLYQDQSLEPPAANPQLRDLRNALEHLDEADIVDSNAVAGEGSWSLKKLPGSRLLIGTYDDGGRLFGVLTSAELEAAALDLIGALSGRIDDAAQKMFDDLTAPNTTDTPGSDEGQ
jgi:hypothetical protein